MPSASSSASTSSTDRTTIDRKGLRHTGPRPAAAAASRARLDNRSWLSEYRANGPTVYVVRPSSRACSAFERAASDSQEPGLVFAGYDGGGQLVGVALDEDLCAAVDERFHSVERRAEDGLAAGCSGVELK